jgi:hypothetical protein
MSRPDPRCDGCGQAGADLGPMLHDYIWRQIAKPGEHTLCAKCMLERTTERLGRLLTLADLRPCPFNLFHRPHSWFDFFVEMEGTPPSSLDEWRACDLFTATGGGAR